jgi:ketosteroid isomerase-like protein
MAASTIEVGRKLVELCKQGKNLEAIDTLYDKDVVSIEVRGDETMPARMQGIEAIRGKNTWWLDSHQIHGSELRGPYPHGERFIVQMRYDATSRSGPFAGKRMQFEEAGLYTVRDGKIVQEEFFYDMPG